MCDTRDLLVDFPDYRSPSGVHSQACENYPVLEKRKEILKKVEPKKEETFLRKTEEIQENTDFKENEWTKGEDLIRLITAREHNKIQAWLKYTDSSIIPAEDRDKGLSLLMLCVGDVKLFKMLLDAGLDPTYRTQGLGETVLTHVVTHHDIHTIQAVSETVVDTCPSAINIPNKGGFTPIQLLLVFHHTQLFGRFVELGADPTIPNTMSGEYPLHQAIRRGQAEVVQSLISLRVPMSPIKKTGETPVHIGAWCKQNYLTYQILRHGANCRIRSKSGTTALHWAAERGDKDMITLLLVAGADPLQRDHFGMNSMMVAERHCGEDVLSVFNMYKKRLTEPLSLLYLARKTFLWKTCSRNTRCVCNDEQCTGGEKCAKLPTFIRDYLSATDHTLLIRDMM